MLVFGRQLGGQALLCVLRCGFCCQHSISHPFSLPSADADRALIITRFTTRYNFPSFHAQIRKHGPLSPPLIRGMPASSLWNARLQHPGHLNLEEKCLIFFNPRDILATTLVRGMKHTTFAFLPPVCQDESVSSISHNRENQSR